jgi:hypothetical protein
MELNLTRHGVHHEGDWAQRLALFESNRIALRRTFEDQHGGSSQEHTMVR